MLTNYNIHHSLLISKTGDFIKIKLTGTRMQDIEGREIHVVNPFE